MLQVDSRILQCSVSGMHLQKQSDSFVQPVHPSLLYKEKDLLYTFASGFRVKITKTYSFAFSFTETLSFYKHMVLFHRHCQYWRWLFFYGCCRDGASQKLTTGSTLGLSRKIFNKQPEALGLIQKEKRILTPTGTNRAQSQRLVSSSTAFPPSLPLKKGLIIV